MECPPIEPLEQPQEKKVKTGHPPAPTPRSSRYRAEFDDRRFCLVTPYLQKFDWETDQGFDLNSLNTHGEEDDNGVTDVRGTITRFLNQVRDSFGFDVDCRPPSWFQSPFGPVNLSKLKEESEVYADIMEGVRIAIEGINADTRAGLNAEAGTIGKTYSFKELKHVVFTVNLLMLLTFNAEAVVDGVADAIAPVIKTIQAIVFEDFSLKGLELLQWRFKPAVNPVSDTTDVA